MKTHWMMPKKRISQHLLTLIVSMTLVSLVMAACSIPGGGIASGGQSVPTPTPTPTPLPTPDANLQQQGTTQLQAFQQLITQMQQSDGDVTTYQQQYTSDQQALQAAKTVATYNTALTTLNGHIDGIKLPEKKAEALSLQKKLKDEVSTWGQQHTHHNDYDNKDYPLGFEYGDLGSGGLADDRIKNAQKLEDYQQAVDDLNMYLTNFQAMTTNFNDKTPYNQPHATDAQLMQSCGRTSGKVIVVSLSEQVMRVYNDGQLVNSFYVTTGRPDRPSLAGCWWSEVKRAPDTFKSGVKPGQDGYYPDTHINYDIMYHSGEYYIHDSWWRADYGPGMNYPHIDSGGDSFANFGSHGCVNMPTASMQWVYNYMDLNQGIIIY
ncbi:L,D-transpeptidase [Tengunoibacter tsumagoiensis]|uniref:L,D-TPase catalytic domain-containing protein n=1 Tax=Tengunoibacter tsumagoiensis TaxID=2014871 RepID=A0A401ZVN0_9CHLR|nr:L,D-transpeptidase [Tengunoibacter tsumagoiensis]GCE10794.1 hypothetical protein KTT_06530 [Tengunoibacter tsumagoiensis]